jgi:uncharacterized protein YaaN involved in tellurite resistance
MAEVIEITPTAIAFQNALVPVADRVVIQSDLSIDEHIKSRIAAARKELNYNDTQSFVFFGSKSQTGLIDISTKMISGVKNKDVSPAADALSAVVMNIRGFSLDDLKENGHGVSSWFHKAVSPIVAAMQRYETVKSQINVVVANLDKHVGILMKDVVSLDSMYTEALTSFNKLQIYVLAGEEELEDLKNNRIAPMKIQAESTGDSLSSQEVAKLQACYQRLERRVHDFKLTKQATLQSLPMIMLIQDGDSNLIEKIQSAIINTIPIWQQRIAMLITAKHAEQAAKAIANVTDLTNELLVETQASLQKSNKAVRTEVERGLFDLEAIRKANEMAIATLNETTTIYQEAATRRRAESIELQKYEGAMRTAMINSGI